MAFNKLKSLLRNDLQLPIFDPNHPTILATDASNNGLCLPVTDSWRTISADCMRQHITYQPGTSLGHQ
uniref:Reverse transcriptase/retrotransposon-derived protein RNase H-like domain-containing protein n=1 Tax=Romanomermis culicivorax TaxID=13658 RepID=A0A915K674_ROMCU